MNNFHQPPSMHNEKGHFVYTTGNCAKEFAGQYPSVDGFICKLGKETVREDTLLDKPVITLEEAAKKAVDVFIVHTFWHDLYNEVRSLINAEHIFLCNDSYEPTEDVCIVCGTSGVFRGHGSFAPFLQERMFLGKTPTTSVMFCPDCGTFYASYRPSDVEIARLYDGYRNDEYVRQRQKFEPNYTAAFNRSLYDEAACLERKTKVSAFLKDAMDMRAVNYVLDFGGDKGQFIPDEFASAKRYVYDISGVDVLEGVERIGDPRQLSEYQWDMIMCCHVMEHLPDIQAYFRQMVSYLPAGAYLYIEVPYEHPDNMEFTWIHEHINMFGRNAFAKLAKRHGLKVLKTTIRTSIKCLMQRK